MTEEEQLEYALKMSLAQIPDSAQTSEAVASPTMDEDMKEAINFNL